ncbi:MAG: hypothetical protein EXS31_13295 [Pedosphaera sp.]|nr:hypothetical protein [Pedosphaera sp.]
MFIRVFGTCIVVCVITLGTGCGSHSQPPAASTVKNPSENISPESAAGEPGQTAIAAILDELTQVVRRYGAEQQRVPKTLEEVVAAGYLSRVPLPPAGKRFAINKNLQVYLAGQ